MTGSTPKGFNCTKCGAWHEFPSYVYAHWRETLTHECECGTKHVMVRGIVMPAKDDKELADAGRMLAKEMSKVAGELRARGYQVGLQGYYARNIDGGEYWEFQCKKVTEERI